MSFTVIRFHLRGLRRHLAGLAREVLGIGELRTDFSTTSHGLHVPRSPSHPSELCTCSCGRDGATEDHLEICPWARWRCQGCGGQGYCAECCGDGIDPEAPLSAYQQVEEG